MVKGGKMLSGIPDSLDELIRSLKLTYLANAAERVEEMLKSMQEAFAFLRDLFNVIFRKERYS